MNYKQAWDRFGGLTWDDLPSDVQTLAQQCALDWYGCALAGAREPLAGLLRDEFAHRGGDCGVIGADIKLEPATAALLNGASGHALDFDETNPGVGCHAVAPVLPAVLAAAQAAGASGARLLTAFVVGLEIEGRVGMSIGGRHYLRGWHTTATFGTFGAAAGVAHVLGLDQAGYETAMALAASSAAGVKANFGTMTKPYHAGQSAERGLIAARLAARGFTANRDAVEGNQGYLHAAGDGDNNHAEALAAKADSWLIRDALFKYHAACHLTHASIENVLQVRDRVPVDAIEQVTLTVNPSILDVCGIPTPTTGLEGKFSLRGTTALAWLGENTGDAATFVDTTINRDDVQALLQRVNVDTDQSLTTFQSRLLCVDRSKQSFDAYWDTNQPAADLAVQGERLAAKFRLLGGTTEQAAAIAGLADAERVAAL